MLLRFHCCLSVDLLDRRWIHSCLFSIPLDINTNFFPTTTMKPLVSERRLTAHEVRPTQKWLSISRLNVAWLIRWIFPPYWMWIPNCGTHAIAFVLSDVSKSSATDRWSPLTSSSVIWKTWTFKRKIGLYSASRTWNLVRHWPMFYLVVFEWKQWMKYFTNRRLPLRL